MKKAAPIRLSSHWLGPWKYFLFGAYSVGMALLLYLFLSDAETTVDWLLGLVQAGIYIYLFILALRITNNFQQLCFDSDFAYVQLKDQELMIPLENIKDVNLKSIAGTYEVTLYSSEQVGDKFYFKISLLYPLNHKSKEALIDRFWAAIERAKSKKQDVQRNALLS